MDSAPFSPSCLILFPELFQPQDMADSLHLSTYAFSSHPLSILPMDYEMGLKEFS